MSDFIRQHLQALKQQATRRVSPTHTAKHSNLISNRISKSRLPEPRTFYGAYGLTLKGSIGWEMVKCPFHDDTHASMGVNCSHGGFKCHACDASGDMIGFYMQYHKVTFIDACKALQLDKG